MAQNKKNAGSSLYQKYFQKIVYQMKESATVNKFINDRKYFTLCHRILVEWYYNHQKHIEELMKKAAAGKPDITVEQFYIILQMNDCPLKSSELLAISILLDAESTGRIPYENFVHTLWTVYCEIYRVILKQDNLGNDSVYKEPMQLQKENDKWILMTFKYNTFEDIVNHPYHFQELLSTSTTIKNVRKILHRKFGWPHTSFVFYRPDNDVVPLTVHDEMLLTSIGFTGSLDRDNPTVGKLVYDFETGSVDCPLLLFKHNEPKMKKTRNINSI